MAVASHVFDPAHLFHLITHIPWGVFTLPIVTMLRCSMRQIKATLCSIPLPRIVSEGWPWAVVIVALGGPGYWLDQTACDVQSKVFVCVHILVFILLL